MPESIALAGSLRLVKGNQGASVAYRIDNDRYALSVATLEKRKPLTKVIQKTPSNQAVSLCNR